MFGALVRLLDAITDYTVGTAIVFAHMGIMGYRESRPERPELGPHAEVLP